jgi:hypothetical protein
MDKQTEYIEKLSAQMVEWDAQIDHLKEKAENATAGEKYEYSRTIATVQLKRDQAAEQLSGISAASADEWEDMKAGAEQMWDEVREFLWETLRRVR